MVRKIQKEEAEREILERDRGESQKTKDRGGDTRENREGDRERVE